MQSQNKLHQFVNNYKMNKKEQKKYQSLNLIMRDDSLAQKTTDPNNIQAIRQGSKNTISLNVFKSSLSLKIKEIMFDQQKLNIFSKPTWTAIYGRYQTQKWQEILFHMTCAICEELVLYNNNHSQILKTLTFTTFIHLKHLQIGWNQITNIECLSFLNTEMIQKIGLQNNQIIVTKAFKKLKWKHLSDLYLHNNYITFMELSRTKMTPKASQTFSELSAIQTLIVQDLSFLVKLQPIEINRMYINSLNRIDQKSLKILFFRRFKSIKLID